MRLKAAQLLYEMSLHISQAKDLSSATMTIARTAYFLFRARNCGLLLASPEGIKEAEAFYPAGESHGKHPHNLIEQAISTRQVSYLEEHRQRVIIAAPIQTARRCYGALWLEFSPVPAAIPTKEDLQSLITQAAFTLERLILLTETQQQAAQLIFAYQQLDSSYDQLLVALMKALDARDRETEGHSVRVAQLAAALGEDMELCKSDLKALERGALLHDLGKIGISDTVLHKPGPLDHTEWESMREHPEIGARIIQEIPALQDALPVIAHHQERWNGSGYPQGLRGEEIPLLARIFAVVDVYDALTSNRPYRNRLHPEEALEYLESNAGILFDPEIVARLGRLIRSNPMLSETGCDNPTKVEFSQPADLFDEFDL